MPEWTFARDGKNWNIVDEKGLVLATLRPYTWGREYTFFIHGISRARDASKRVAYPGLVRSKNEGLQTLRIVLGHELPPERWSGHYYLPEGKAR